MKWVRPKVTLLAGTMLYRTTVFEYLRERGVVEERLAAVMKTLSSVDSEALVGLAGKRCYLSFEPGINPNVKRVRADYEEHLGHMLEVGHGSVLEHANYTFGIEGGSRVFTGEMNRHRAGMAISEGSMRFISFDELVMVEPPSFRRRPDSPEGMDMYDEIVRDAVKSIADMAETNYLAAIAELRTLGYDSLPMERKKQLTSALRRGIPMGIATGGVWTGNVRALRHIITMRADPAAEEEIREVALMILAILRSEAPTLFGDFDYEGRPQAAFWKR